MDALRQPRFVAYLLFAAVVLVALAMAGPGWLVAGLCGFVAVEITTTMREAEARRQIAAALARPSQR